MICFKEDSEVGTAEGNLIVTNAMDTDDTLMQEYTASHVIIDLSAKGLVCLINYLMLMQRAIRNALSTENGAYICAGSLSAEAMPIEDFIQVDITRMNAVRFVNIDEDDSILDGLVGNRGEDDFIKADTVTYKVAEYVGPPYCMRVYVNAIDFVAQSDSDTVFTDELGVDQLNEALEAFGLAADLDRYFG